MTRKVAWQLSARRLCESLWTLGDGDDFSVRARNAFGETTLPLQLGVLSAPNSMWYERKYALYAVGTSSIFVNKAEMQETVKARWSRMQTRAANMIAR